MRSETDAGGRRYWERHAAGYDRSMRILGRPLPRMLELVQREVRGASDVLEVAAGTGLVTVAIARVARRVVATDYAAAMVDLLRERLRREGLDNVECLARDLYVLDFAPRSFDAVVCANVLHLVPDLEGALRATMAMLRPGGRLVAPTFVHSETLVSRAASRVIAMTGFPARRRFTAATLGSAIEDAGFNVRVAETIAGFIPVAFVSGTVR